MALTLDPAAYAATFDAAVGGFVRDAAERVPGFAARLRQAELRPEELSTVASLDRLPVLTKDMVVELQAKDPPFAGLVAPGARPRRVFASPGPIYEVELPGQDRWRWRAALEAAGFTRDDMVLNAFSYHLSPAGAMFEQACLDLGCAVLPGGVGNTDAQVRACADLGVTAFVGVPSYLKRLLEAAAGEELALRRAFVSAEPLPPSLRAWLLERLEVVLQGYGTAETGNLGYECAAMDGWHVPLGVLVQVCDLTTGEAVVDGREGQIVVTVLSSEAPMVRFGTGDLSAWHDLPCACGDPAPKLRGWLGRVGDGVKVRGMFLHPRQVSQVMGRVPEVARSRFTVDRADHRDVLSCEVVVTSGEAAEVAERVRALVRAELRFDVEVSAVASLPDDGPVIADRRSWD